MFPEVVAAVREIGIVLGGIGLPLTLVEIGAARANRPVTIYVVNHRTLPLCGVALFEILDLFFAFVLDVFY